MTHSGSRSYELSSTKDGGDFRKRKVRKGTQSCWECKRRKTKCHFIVSTNNATCDGCKRRGTRCVSQEFPENPASNREQLGDRIGRVEELLNQLAQNKGASVGDARSKSTTYADGRPLICQKERGFDFTASGLAQDLSQSSHPSNLDGLAQEEPVSGSFYLVILLTILCLVMMTGKLRLTVPIISRCSQLASPSNTSPFLLLSHREVNLAS